MKLYTYPPGVCIKLYELLVTHVTRQYDQQMEYSSNVAAGVRNLVSFGNTQMIYIQNLPYGGCSTHIRLSCSKFNAVGVRLEAVTNI